MSNKPTSLASILGPKPDSLRETGRTFGQGNRFAALRDRSRSLSTGPATKRSAEEEAGGDGKAARIDNHVFAQMEKVEAMVVEGKDMVAKMAADMDKMDAPQEIKVMMGRMVNFMAHMVVTVESLASTMVDNEKLKVGREEEARAAGGKDKEAGKDAKPPPTAEEVRKKKFVQAVKEAEKAVLVFGLDLGKVPIMNRQTLSASVARNIADKAAKVDKQEGDRPKEDTVTIIDDTLSMMKGMDFFGRTTKPAKDKEGKDAGYHTMPVSMQFRDRDSKLRAEQVFRQNCEIRCTTPYPKRLRDLMNKVMEEQKAVAKDSFIQVRVDLDSLSLKVSRRTGNVWENNVAEIEIDEQVMDLGRTGNQPNPQVVVGMETL